MDYLADLANNISKDCIDLKQKFDCFEIPFYSLVSSQLRSSVQHMSMTEIKMYSFYIYPFIRN